MDMSASKRTYPKMAKLSLARIFPSMDQTIIQDVFSRLPALRVFSIDHVADPRALLLVPTLCPTIKVLLHDTPLSTLSQESDIFSHRCIKPGLRKLCIDGSELDTSDFFAVLEENKDTLQELRYWHRPTSQQQLVRYRTGFSDGITTPLVSQLKYLTTFFCELEDRRSQYIATCVLQHASHLEHVSIKNNFIDTTWNDTIFDALVALTNLHTLDLCMRRINDNALQRFADRHCGKAGIGATLKHISLGAFYGLCDETLYKIACIPSLESISIDILSNLPHITDAGIMALLACPRLQQIQIESCDRISDDALSVLKDKAHISNLHVK
ncbi:hypothetical protein K492DRAFT_179441 [Lichtheimia hyalospora FSU 10163]|nr:hypothetical protein K492DRAFT_179441 [Lichtheimia hyalospora FSU 10163]